MLREGITGFEPVYAKHAQVLILGSYPSPKSFEQGFYYGHPQNRFWPLLASLLGLPVPQNIEEKRALIINNQLALWDSLQSCTITGAADTSITNPVKNDIEGLVKQCGIQNIFCNGAAAYKFYKRFNQPNTGIAAVQLPSTSAAYAACSLDKLRTHWQPLLAALGRPPVA